MTDGKAATTTEPKPLLQRTWFVVACGLGFGGLLIFSNHFGYAGVVEWSVIFAIGLGISAAFFWQRRHARWFWFSIAFLATVDVFLLIKWHWDVVPSPGAINIKGAVGLVVGLDCLWLFWMSWLFDPREKPKTAATKTVEIVLYGMAVAIIGIVAFLSWAVPRKHEQKLAQAKVVLEKATRNTMSDLTWCLTPDAKEHRAWENVDGHPNSKSIYNYVYDVGMTVEDRGDFRLLRVSTWRGGPVDQRDAKLLGECL